MGRLNSLNVLFLFDTSVFNEPIRLWDVSNVKNMDSMFFHASNFDQPIRRVQCEKHGFHVLRVLVSLTNS